MSPEFLKKFIEEYCKLPALWHIDNKIKRDQAWNSLLQFTRKEYPDVDLDFVKKKIKGIRDTFRRECHRVRKSRRRGALYKPTLWYYDMLLFTQNQRNIQKSENNLNEKTKDEKTEDVDEDKSESTVNISNDSIVSTAMEDEAEQSAIPSTSFNAVVQSRKNSVVDKIDDEYDTLGKIYAAKLRRMPDDQKDIADKLINDVLFMGLMNHLTPTVTISDY